MAKEQEYTAECEVTVVVYATSAKKALAKVQEALDDIGHSGTIESMEDEEGNDVTDGEEPEGEDE